MKELAFSPAALADMDAIWDYDALLWGPDQADACIDDIVQAWDGLAKGRKTGKTAARPGSLKLSVGAYMLYFQDRAIERQDVDRPS